jgi:hypothetical protein
VRESKELCHGQLHVGNNTLPDSIKESAMRKSIFIKGKTTEADAIKACRSAIASWAKGRPFRFLIELETRQHRKNNWWSYAYLELK